MNNKISQGFTLIELVIGIIVLAVAMMVMNTMLISQSKDALEPLYRLRASQLGQSILQDILSRSYDENSDHNGGYYRCDESWGESVTWYDRSTSTWITSETPECADENYYGIDSVSSSEVDGDHQDFNDVDDFIEDEFVSVVDYGDVLGDELSSQYNNYYVKIAVEDTTIADTAMKRIDVTIKTPSDEKILFSVLKGNY